MKRLRRYIYIFLYIFLKLIFSFLFIYKLSYFASCSPLEAKSFLSPSLSPSVSVPRFPPSLGDDGVMRIDKEAGDGKS